MRVELQWKNQMSFDAKAGGHTVSMDAKAPVGRNTAANPKELLASALCGCSAMDVIGLMRKYKQDVTQFSVKAEIDATTTGTPTVFSGAKLSYYLEGSMTPEQAVEAVRLSHTLYCGVSAMLAKAFPITWEVFVNGSAAGSGQASFQDS